MAYVLHMYPDLVRAPGFQPAFNQGNIIESFQHFVMCDGIFSMVAIRVSRK